MTLISLIRQKATSAAWRVARSVSNGGVRRFRLPDGSPFDYPIDSDIGRALFVGRFEEGELAFMISTLSAGDIVLDVGANGGAYTVVAARIVGREGHVYAFEPGVRELTLLRNNIALNELTNVTIIEAAASDADGTNEFFVSADGAMSSLRRTDHPGQRVDHVDTVRTLTLDSFARERGIDRVNFVKIDVEGAEPLVFAGAHSLFDASPGARVLFESADVNARAYHYQVEQFIRNLEADGYDVRVLLRDGTTASTTPWLPEYGSTLYNFIAQRRASGR